MYELRQKALRSLTSIKGGVSSGFQAIEHQRGEHFWQFLPARGNQLVTEQLGHKQAKDGSGDGTYCQGHIDLAQLPLFHLRQEVVLSDPECRHKHLLVIQIAQFRIDQHLRQYRPENFGVRQAQRYSLAYVGFQQSATTILASPLKLIHAFTTYHTLY